MWDLLHPISSEIFPCIYLATVCMKPTVSDFSQLKFYKASDSGWCCAAYYYNNTI